MIGFGQKKSYIESTPFHTKIISFLYEIKNDNRTEIEFFEDDDYDGYKYTLYDTELNDLKELLSLPICSPGFYGEVCIRKNTNAFLSILEHLQNNKVYFWTRVYLSGLQLEKTGNVGWPSFYIVLLDENYMIIDMISYCI